MNYKEAKAYLQPIADNATLTGYKEALAKAIEAFEIADSVVRCKDCFFSCMNTSSSTLHCTTHNGRKGVVGENEFCSYGERR